MNLLDEFNQATLDGVRYAAQKGVGIVIMEPLRGGMLAKNPPENVAGYMQSCRESVPISTGASAGFTTSLASRSYFRACRTWINSWTICAYSSIPDQTA